MFNNLVITHLSVLIDIETFLLNTLVNAQTMQFLDTVEEGKTTGSCPEVDDQYAKHLSTEESPTITIEGTVARREQTCHNGSKDTTDTMYT